MVKLARPIVAFDEILLDRVVQPVLDRLARVRDARYRLAAAPIDLCAGVCLAWVAIAVMRAADPLEAAVQHGVVVMVLLLGLASGRTLVAHARSWDGFEASLGLERRNPNRVWLRPYRLAMLAVGIFCLAAVAVGERTAVELVFTAYLWALAASAYVLSGDDPRPRREPRRSTGLVHRSAGPVGHLG